MKLSRYYKSIKPDPVKGRIHEAYFKVSPSGIVTEIHLDSKFINLNYLAFCEYWEFHKQQKSSITEFNQKLLISSLNSTKFFFPLF